MASLGQTLLKRRDINLIQLNLALDFRVFYGGKLGTNLLELGILSEEALCEALAEHMGIPCALPPDFDHIPMDVLQRLPREVAYRCQAIPFHLSGGQVYVAMADPRNDQAVRQVSAQIGGPIVLHVAPELRVQTALERFYQIRMDPRLKNLAVKVASRHDRRPPGPFQGFQPPPLGLTKPPDPTAGWVTDEPSASLESLLQVPAEEKPIAKVALSVQKISLMLEEAESRDEIAELALQFAQRYLKRAGLFVLRKDIGFGWDGRGEGLTRERIKGIVVPLSEPSIFQTVLESQGHFLGVAPDSPVNNQFFSALGGDRPRNVLLLPLTIGGITFGVIYGDNGKAGVNPEEINELQVMVSRVNIAFEKLIIAERRKALRHHASV